MLCEGGALHIEYEVTLCIIFLAYYVILQLTRLGYNSRCHRVQQPAFRITNFVPSKVTSKGTKNPLPSPTMDARNSANIGSVCIIRQCYPADRWKQPGVPEYAPNWIASLKIPGLKAPKRKSTQHAIC